MACLIHLQRFAVYAPMGQPVINPVRGEIFVETVPVKNFSKPRQGRYLGLAVRDVAPTELIYWLPLLATKIAPRWG